MVASVETMATMLALAEMETTEPIKATMVPSIVALSRNANYKSAFTAARFAGQKVVGGIPAPRCGTGVGEGVGVGLAHGTRLNNRLIL